MALLDLNFYIDLHPTESNVNNGLVFGYSHPDEETHTPGRLTVVTDSGRVRANWQRVNTLLMDLALSDAAEEELKQFGVQFVEVEQVNAESRFAWNQAVNAIKEISDARTRDAGDRSRFK